MESFAVAEDGTAQRLVTTRDAGPDDILGQDICIIQASGKATIGRGLSAVAAYDPR
jgi:hypothetical protein